MRRVCSVVPPPTSFTGQERHVVAQARKLKHVGGVALLQRVRDTHAICNVRQNKIPYGGSKLKMFNTKNVIRHIKKHHPVEHGKFVKLTVESEKKRKAEKAPAAPTRQVTQTTLESTRPYDRDSQKAKAITRKVMEFMGPFSVAENAGFRRLLFHIDPHYTLPGRNSGAPPGSVFTHTVGSLLKENVSSISFTSDICSSDVSPMSMLSLTANMFDADFQLQKAVLHCREFSGSHTAFENMFHAYSERKRACHCQR